MNSNQIEAFYVPKSYGTYSDTCLMLGLACLAEYALDATGQKQGMQLIDEGICYQIQFNKPMDLSKIKSVSYFDLFPIVAGAKTKTEKIPKEIHYFSTVENSQARSLFKTLPRKIREKWREDVPDPPDSRTQNGTILTSMRHDRNHNGLWEEAWKLREHFGELVSTTLEVFSDRDIVLQDSAVDSIAKTFKQKTGEKLPTQASAVKIYMPSSIQGINRVLADGIGSNSQKDAWLNLWLIAKGLFDFAVSERIKITDKTFDWRVVVLEPRDISLNHYRSVLNDLRKKSLIGSGYGIARFDAELALRFSQEMLNLSCKTSRKPKLVSFFRGSHFGSKGQVYGLKDIFSLGLPNWIKVSSDETKKAIALHKVLAEHLSVVRSLDEKHTEILAAYRDFITGKELELFFPFQASYAEYVIKQLADLKANNPYLFSTEGLNTMVRNFKNKTEEQDWSINEIIENPGFLRIAKAINQATVYAGKIQTKDGVKELDWQRNYGLAQRLSSHADSEKDFIRELTSFLISYENENVRLTEKLQKDGKKLYRVWTNKEDLDQVFSLIKDKRFGCSLVANLLVAYGYAKWSKKLSEEKPEDEFEITEETNNKK